MKALIIFLTFLAFSIKVQGGSIIGAQVSCDPSIAGSTSATLYISGIVATNIPSGGVIKIVLPTDVSIIQGTLTTCTV